MCRCHCAAKIVSPWWVSQEPIDVPKQVRTLALCCNRQFSEQGLTNVIVKHYKGAVMMDVLERILVIYYNVLRPTSYTDPLFDKSCQELIGYVRYYADSVAFMSELMPLLAIDDIGWGRRDNRDLAPLQRPLVMPLADIILRVTQANPQELGAYFVLYCYRCLSHPLHYKLKEVDFNKWNATLIHSFLQTETIDLILQVVDCMDLYLVPIRNHRDSTGTLVPELVYGVTRQLLREFVRLLIDYRPFSRDRHLQLLTQVVPRIHSLSLAIQDNASDMSLDDYLDAYDSDDSEDW